MDLNQTVAGVDLAQVLQFEAGLFDAKAASGERLKVTRTPGGTITLIEQVKPWQPRRATGSPQDWHITKIAEIQAQPSG